MAAQAGKDLLLKLDAAGDGTFVSVAGLRSTRLAFNAAPIDVTTIESADRWRELLDGAGLKTAEISGSGVFKDAASDAEIRALFFAGGVRPWRVLVPDFGVVEGPFQIASLEYAGAHDGEATFELALVSAGPLAFAPE